MPSLLPTNSADKSANESANEPADEPADESADEYPATYTNANGNAWRLNFRQTCNNYAVDDLYCTNDPPPICTSTYTSLVRLLPPANSRQPLSPG